MQVRLNPERSRYLYCSDDVTGVTPWKLLICYGLFSETSRKLSTDCGSGPGTWIDLHTPAGAVLVIICSVGGFTYCSV